MWPIRRLGFGVLLQEVDRNISAMPRGADGHRTSNAA
jgi:hypothetical protein